MKIERNADDDSTYVSLDLYNSDLNLVIDASKFSAHPLTNEGFAFMWAGARATYGIDKGKICFEVKISKHIDVSHLPADEPNPHVVRVGFSVESSTLQLGEDPLSYGYGGTGKMSTNCQFKDYGTTFAEGDTIMGLLNYDSDPVQIGFAKNGKFLGWAYRITKSQLQEQALFPHVLTKNCSFEVNFGQMDKPFFPLPEGFNDYTFIGCIPLDLRIRGTKAPEKREDCEMIMMCGLPGAGKSVWSTEYSFKHPEKKYNILGTNNIIDKMKVMGLPRKRNYHGRWDVLIQMATKCLNKMFEIGSKLRRNYILDQTNVYPTAQRRKMRNFEGFQRKAVVIVPTDEEFQRRCAKREKEEGKEIPDHAVLEMKANFKLPEVCDIFDEVIFIELQREEAEKLVRHYNEEGRASVGPNKKHFKPQDQSPGTRGGSRGGNNGNRGGNFDSNRSGAGSPNRGGYNNRSNFGGFDTGRNDYESEWGGFKGGRGGFTGNRGGRNDFDRKPDINSPGVGRFGGSGNFMENESSNFNQPDYGGGYGPPSGYRDSPGYGNSSPGGFGNRGLPRGNSSYRGDMNRGPPPSRNYGRDYGNEGNMGGQYSDMGYGNEPALGAYDKGSYQSSSGNQRNNRGGNSRGSSRGRGSRGGNSRGGYSGSGTDNSRGNYGGNSSRPSFGGDNGRGSYGGSDGSRGGYSRGGDSSRAGYNNSGNSSYGGYGESDNYSRDSYNYGSGGSSNYPEKSQSSYDYGSNISSDYGNRQQENFRGSSNNFNKPSTGGYKKDSSRGGGQSSKRGRGNSNNRGRTSSGTRWESQQSFNQRSTSGPQGTSAYSGYGAQVKSEPATTASSGYDSYSGQNPGYTNYGQNTTSNQGYQASQSTYNYQHGQSGGSQWTDSSSYAGGSQSGHGAVASQPQQWSQYYQPQTQPNQYYNQYYGQ